MNIKHMARATLIRLAVLAGILVALTLVINLPWFDEELHEDLAQLTPPQNVSMDGNAYASIYGFTAASDQDPRTAGLQIISALRQHFEAGERATLTSDEMNAILGHPGPAPDWAELLQNSSCNPRYEIDCADLLIAEATKSGFDDPGLPLLISRFGQLLTEPRFEEAQEMDVFTPIPPYGALVPVSRIRLALSFRDHTPEQILDDLGQDIGFWKRMLDGGQTLIAKMVALAGLRNDTYYMATLIRTRQLSADQLRRVPDVFSPLTESERNIEETFLAELRIGMLSKLPAPTILKDSRFLGLVIQKNATANEYYMATTLPLRLRASLTAAEFYRQRAFEPLSYPMRFVPPPLYNLGGKILLRDTIATINWQDYITRVHDLDGRISLVLLQAEVALNPDASVEDVARASRYRNPYTGEPMHFDSANGTLDFPCLSIGKDVCAIRIR